MCSRVSSLRHDVARPAISTGRKLVRAALDAAAVLREKPSTSVAAASLNRAISRRSRSSSLAAERRPADAPGRRIEARVLARRENLRRKEGAS